MYSTQLRTPKLHGDLQVQPVIKWRILRRRLYVYISARAGFAIRMRTNGYP